MFLPRRALEGTQLKEPMWFEYDQVELITSPLIGLEHKPRQNEAGEGGYPMWNLHFSSLLKHTISNSFQTHSRSFIRPYVAGRYSFPSPLLTILPFGVVEKIRDVNRNFAARGQSWHENEQTP